MLDHRIEGKLNGNPRIKDNDFPTHSQHRVTIVLLEELPNGITASFADHLPLVLQHHGACVVREDCG